MLLIVPKNLLKFEEPMRCTRSALIFLSLRAKRSIDIPARILVNFFFRFRPETESGMKNPVPDKPKPESNLKFPVPAMYNGIKIWGSLHRNSIIESSIKSLGLVSILRL